MSVRLAVSEDRLSDLTSKGVLARLASLITMSSAPRTIPKPRSSHQSLFSRKPRLTNGRRSKKRVASHTLATVPSDNMTWVTKSSTGEPSIILSAFEPGPKRAVPSRDTPRDRANTMTANIANGRGSKL